MTRRRTYGCAALAAAMMAGCGYSPPPPPASGIPVRTTTPPGVDAPAEVTRIPASGEGWNIELDSVRTEMVLPHESGQEETPGRGEALPDRGPAVLRSRARTWGDGGFHGPDRVIAVAEDGTAYGAVGGGSDGSYCRCEFALSSGDNLIEFGYVFVISDDLPSQRYRVHFKDTPPLRFVF